MWILVFFSILATAVCKIIFTQLKLSRVMEEKAICPYLAKAACLYAWAEKQEDSSSYDSAEKLKKVRERAMGNVKFTYTQADEESKININTASAEALSRLPGMSLELGQKILASPLRPFSIKQELMCIEDLTDKDFLQFKDFITVYGNGSVNINTAPVEVLIALGIDDSLASNIVDFRKGVDKEEGTPDDEVFENTGEIINKLRSISSLSGDQEAELVSLISQNALSVATKNLVLQVQTYINAKPAMRYAVVMDAKNNKIKQWNEY
ncbi:MAG: helix-hairpin-helix domain-containing protein [Candidatus Omnitrophica bacterium]|nr:helix-hairpin-helix domain-containing protein [Candidatus Omnitrophota bacterium]